MDEVYNNKQWNILALDSSGRILSVGLLADGNYREFYIDTGLQHAETLMPAVEFLVNNSSISPKNLDLVVCSAGPGSFTSLRIGMATAKGIARGANCDLKAVPALPLLATGREYWPGVVVPVMNAGRNRVYAAAFQNGKRLMDDNDIDLSQFLDSLPIDESILITGPDAHLAEGKERVIIDPLFDSSRGRFMIEMACHLYDRDGGGDPGDLGPVYIRRSDAEEKLLGEDWQSV